MGTRVDAGMVEVGHSFIWQKDSYVVLRHENDRVIVHRTVNSLGQVIEDKYRSEENFNPYAVVELVLC